MSASDEGGLDRLADAVEKYLGWEQAGRIEDKEALLAANRDLQDLLQPLIASADQERDSRAAWRESEQDAVLAGRVLGDYELGAEIGRGAMGLVHRARQVSLGRDVALKLLPAHANLRAHARARFRREASIVARFEHPGIVKILGVGEEDGLTFFAMDLIHGISLEDVVRRLRGRDIANLSGQEIPLAIEAEFKVRTPWDSGSSGAGRRSESSQRHEIGWRATYIETVTQLIAQAAHALEHAHQNGVIHRDVKPSNLLLKLDGRIVLTDFGLARDAAAPALTATGEFAGTPYYTSPEQALGEHARVDRRTDVWALGVTFYELLCHHRPFEGRSAHEVFQRIQRDEPLDPRRHVRELPRDLCAIAAKAMQKDPALRYQTAGEMAADLEAYLRHEPVRARPAGPWRRLRRWAKRDPFRAALCAVLLIGIPTLAALSGYLLARRDTLIAGEKALQRDRLEVLLANAYGALHDDPANALPLFEALRREYPEDSASAIGLGLAIEKTRGESAAAKFLEALPIAEDRAIQRLVRLYRTSSNEIDAQVSDMHTHLEAFVEGMLVLSRGMQIEDRTLHRRAAFLLRTSALLAPAPRRFVLQELAKAVGFLNDPELAEECATALSTHWPQDARAQYWAGFAWRATDADRSIQYTAHASELDPQDDTVAFYHAMTLLEERRIDQLLAFADDQLRSNPLTGQADGLRGLALEERGELDAAKAAFEQAVAKGGLIFPLEVRAQLGSGAPEQAERLLLQRQASEPGKPRWWFERMLLRTRAQDWNGVLRLAEEAAIAIPGHDRMQLMQGRALARLGRTDEALPRLIELLESRERSAAAYEIALLYQRQNQLERAEPFAQIAVEADPKRFHPHYVYGCILGGLGRHADAKVELRAALAIDDRPCDAHYNLGAMHHMLGEIDEAIACYRRALEIDEDFEPARAALELAENAGR